MLAALCKELDDLLGIGVELGGMPVAESTEPWPKPVKTAAVLQRLQKKIAKHAVMQPH